MLRFIFTLAALFVVITAAQGYAADPAGFKTLAIGDAAPDFKLPGVDGKDYSLDSFKSAKLLAIIFTCNHCPTAQAYEDRIIQLHADYKDKSVALVAISPNDPLAVRLDELGYTEFSDSLDEMKQRAKDRDFQAAAKAFNAAAVSGDLNAIKSSFEPLGKSCKACHDTYRAEHHPK